MHFVVSWDIKSEGHRWKEINEAMKEGLKKYSWVRPLKTFYIVKVSSQTEWNIIKESLVMVVKRFPKEVYFVMSPLMDGGRYNGWLPTDLWPKIRERSE